MQHYVIKFVGDRWFARVTPASPTNKTDRHDVTEIVLKVALNTIIQPCSIILSYIKFWKH